MRAVLGHVIIFMPLTFKDLPPQENYRYTPSSLCSFQLCSYGLGILRYVSTAMMGVTLLMRRAGDEASSPVMTVIFQQQ